MKRSTKYVALAVHQATTVASVREEGGRVIARTVLPTEGRSLLEFFRGMRGAVHVAFEEGTQAQWLHDLLVHIGDWRNRSTSGGDKHLDVVADIDVCSMHHCANEMGVTSKNVVCHLKSLPQVIP